MAESRTKRVDPARDLLDLIGKHAQSTSKQVLPQLDTGTVILVNDPSDGTVVQLDNMSVAASDCNLLGTHAPTVGDRVLVLVYSEEFWIIGGIQGQSTGSSSGAPSGPAGGDLGGTYPNPTVTDAALARGFKTGMVMMWGTGTAPSGWLLLDGSAVSRGGANAALFALWGTTYGVGDGSTTFNVMDMKGRAAIGAGTGSYSGTVTNRVLGDKGGRESVQLTTPQLPAHNHGSATIGLISPPTITTGGPSTANTGTPSVASTGAGTSHTHGVTDGGHNHNAIGGVIYAGGTTTVTNRISGSLNAGGGVTTTATTTITTTDATGVSVNAEAAHTHSMQSHTHSLSAHTHSSTMPNHDHTVGTDGSDLTHENMMPFSTLNFIVKL